MRALLVVFLLAAAAATAATEPAPFDQRDAIPSEPPRGLR